MWGHTQLPQPRCFPANEATPPSVSVDITEIAPPRKVKKSGRCSMAGRRGVHAARTLSYLTRQQPARLAWNSKSATVSLAFCSLGSPSFFFLLLSAPVSPLLSSPLFLLLSLLLHTTIPNRRHSSQPAKRIPCLFSQALSLSLSETTVATRLSRPVSSRIFPLSGQ